ncbi:MAG: PIN domain-containing protein [Acidobacteriia bacterium]|nr:PIN domain-containing protein [Terriglobia bacterium]
MVLVDTSVWVGHFRKNDTALAQLLIKTSVLMHPFVLGELACGHLRNRAAVLSDLEALPVAVQATNEEVLRLIEERRLWGQGIGWVDTHLLASALLSNCSLWTLDEKLDRTANDAGVKRCRGV